jgi:hypothetical protein
MSVDFTVMNRPKDPMKNTHMWQCTADTGWSPPKIDQVAFPVYYTPPPLQGRAENVAISTHQNNNKRHERR